MPSDTTRDRRGYLDWLRGVGVLIMIEAHTLDSWTRTADRHTHTYGWAMVLGGFGAPIFLFLAGIAIALASGARRRRGMSDAAANARARRRAWQIFLFAFLFRLQSLLISGGGLAAFLKVDILNVMGVTMLIAALLWSVGRTPRGRAMAMSVATALAAMLTPIVRTTPLLAWLPDPIEGYLRPAAGKTTFTLFPWAGFLFGGVVVGLWLDSSHGAEERRRNLGLLAAGTVVAMTGYAASFLPPIYPETSFWTSSPTFFFLRLGILVALVPLAFGWMAAWRAAGRRWPVLARSPLQEFGVASLFVYWIHVEMVYGVASTPLHRALTFGQAVAAMALFSLFLFGLVLAKKRLSRGGRQSEIRAKFAQFRTGLVAGRPQSG